MGDITSGDIICAVLLFASWVGLFIRYGFGVQAITYLILFTLLMVAATFDRKAEHLPKLLIAALGILWLCSIWFLPYGIGPLNTAAGAGGLVPTFAGIFGMGHIATLLDCLLGALGTGIVSFLVMMGSCMISGREFRASIMLFATTVALFLGTVGSALTLGIAVIAWVLITLLKPLFSRFNNDPLSSSMYYSSGGAATVEGHKMALAITLATIFVFLFL